MSVFDHAGKLRLPRRTRATAACTTLAVTGLLTLGVTVPAQAAATRPFLYVANGIGNNVTVYDIDAATTAATIPGSTQPQGVLATPDGRTVYVANAIGGIQVVDTATNAITATIADSSFPIALALSPDATTLYAANEPARSR